MNYEAQLTCFMLLKSAIILTLYYLEVKLFKFICCCLLRYKHFFVSKIIKIKKRINKNPISNLFIHWYHSL